VYKGNRILCVIPARGGSKGLPGKNVRQLNGKPLLAHTVFHAHCSKLIDRTIVSTDSREIARVAKKYKADVPFMRPATLAQDSSSSIDVILHALSWIEKNEKCDFDIVVLLQVTSPLRRAEDIDNAIKMLVDRNADNVFSVAQTHRNPYFNMVARDLQGRVRRVKNGTFITRQSAPSVFDINGSIYVWWKKIVREKKSMFLKRTMIYEMPKERSVDIDDLFDFTVAQALLRTQ
jgi:N-acylneuraminate cytidylyltransferase/CMP-N,N'-diacetyllegionaminic acid synthase